MLYKQVASGLETTTTLYRSTQPSKAVREISPSQTNNREFITSCHILLRIHENCTMVPDPQWPSGLAIVWHLITDCHLCVGSTPKSDNAEDVSQYDLGC